MTTLNFSEVFKRETDRFVSKFNLPDYYINRELSWIEFNKRVLHHAWRKDVPLLERLKFLGITATNLDEFIMVRFSSILTKIRRDIQEPEISGMLPATEYSTLFDEIMEFKSLQDDCYAKLVKKLSKHDIEIVRYRDLSKDEQEQTGKIFSRSIYPLLTPITIDTTKDFPVIKSGQLNIVVCLEDTSNPNLNVISIIPVGSGMDRVFEIKTKKGEDRKFILLEEIIMNNLHRIFMNKNIIYKGAMRILREADIEMDQNRDVYIVDRMKQTLIRRELSHPIFMDVENNIPKQVMKVLTKLFDIDKSHVFKTRFNVDYSFLKDLPIDVPELQYESFSPQYPEELIGEHDMFTAIDTGDIILHHPYESFGPIIKFLEHAADDPDVVSIKQTLYRVSSANSPIVEALCRAAEKGKQVSVILEIKARFDEGRNISLIEKLKIAGCQLIYGVEELKTHCKFIVIVRKTNKGLKTYCHIGTGNYNDKTSHVYTDLSYFTSNAKIGEDILTVANILTGFSQPRDNINKIFYAPYNIRTKLYDLIDRETKHAKKGKKAFITLKLNSLSDHGIIKRLYQASEAGVKVAIFCRGICSMKPINKNISIKSLIGRFLEHSRIYYFFNDNDPEVFMSSADMLSRNLDRRMELMVPIVDSGARTKVLHILKSYFMDTSNTYVMNAEGKYETLHVAQHFNIHEIFMHDAIDKYKLQHIPKMSLRQKRRT